MHTADDGTLIICIAKICVIFVSGKIDKNAESQGIPHRRVGNAYSIVELTISLYMYNMYRSNVC